MHQLPTIPEIAGKLEEIIAEQVDFERPMNHRAPLVAELGFDSLDLIESSFCIQEYFDFEFSDKNALEELDQALGGGVLIQEGRLTETGFKMVRERMPELAEVDLPEELSAAELQRYFTMETFARLIYEFLSHAPQICPESGQPVQIEAFRPKCPDGKTPAGLPNGDSLLDQWVAEAKGRLEKHV